MGIIFLPQVFREWTSVGSTSKPRHTEDRKGHAASVIASHVPCKAGQACSGKVDSGKGPWVGDYQKKQMASWGADIRRTSSRSGSRHPWDVWLPPRVQSGQVLKTLKIPPALTISDLEQPQPPVSSEVSMTWQFLLLSSTPGCWAELSIICNIQDFPGPQKALDLFVVYHLLLIIWANKTAMRFSFCFQHFKASTFLVKTPRPIITLTPIKGKST